MTDLVQILSFAIETNEGDFHGHQDYGSETATRVPHALVKLLVDGTEPLLSRAERPFDAIVAVGFEDDEGERDLYTCACGVPECAGLHEGVRVAFSGDQVTWRFPLRTYVGRFNPEFAKRHGIAEKRQGYLEPKGCFELRFDRQQYLEALHGLGRTLSNLAKSSPTLVLHPCDIASSAEEAALAQTLTRHLSWIRGCRDDEAMIRQIFGAARHRSLRIETPEANFRLWPAQWRAAVLGRDPGDEERALLEQFAPALALEGRPLVEAIARLDWEMIGDQAQFECPNKPEANLDAQLPVRPTPEYLRGVVMRWVEDDEEGVGHDADEEMAP